MKQLMEKHRILSVSLLLFILAALVYVVLTPRVYLASSRVAIFRMKVENPDNGSDESRNRWIWIRDGLNINSALLSDNLIKKFIDESEVAKKHAQKIQNEYRRLNFFRSLVKVQYTGADENNYIIEVRASDAKLAEELNAYVFNYLRFLAIQKDNEDFESIIQRLNQQASGFDAKSNEHAFYRNKIMKMQFEHAIAQSQKERVFQVISEPSVNEDPIWPKPLAILVLSVLMGLVVGLGLEYLVFLFKGLK